MSQESEAEYEADYYADPLEEEPQWDDTEEDPSGECPHGLPGCRCDGAPHGP